MLRFSDARNFGRTFTGLLLIAGPLLMLLAQIAAPDIDNDDKARELASLAANKGAFAATAIVFLIGALCILGGAIGLIHLFRGRRVGLGQVAASLLVLGATASAGWYTFMALEYEMATLAGLDRAQMAQFLHKVDNVSLELPLLLMSLAGLVVGLVLLGIAAWRRGVVPRWAAAIIVVAGPLNFFSEGKALEIVSFAVLLVGLGSLGWAALQMSDEEWDAPRAAAPAAPIAVAEPTPAV
jgi:hypothetical protein